MGGDGEKAQNVVQPVNTSLDAYNKKANRKSDRAAQQLMSDYASGKTSLQDALAGYHKNFASGRDAWAAEQEAALAPKRQQKIQEYKNKMAEGMGGTGGFLGIGSKHMDPNQIPDEVAIDALKKTGDPDFTHDFKSEYGGGQEMSDADLRSILSTDSSTQQKYNEDWIQNSDLTKGLFGKDGMQHQAEDEASKLIGVNDQNTSDFNSLLNEIKSGDGYKLTEGDHTAYGQLAGDVARTYGQQESSLAQALADRGLSAAPSGAAGAAFSGLQGNKSEALANMQRQVLQDRVNTANQQYQLRGNTLSQKSGLDMNRLNSARSTAGQLGAMAQNAMSNMYGRNMNSQQADMGNLATSAGLTLQGQQAYQNQLNNQFDQIQSTKGPGLGEVLGGIASAGVGAITGGIGTGIGTGLGAALGGGKGKGTKVRQNLPDEG
jgi:hypothetical protein